MSYVKYRGSRACKSLRVCKKFRLYDEDEPFIVTYYKQSGSQYVANEKPALEHENPENENEATVPKKPKLNNFNTV